MDFTEYSRTVNSHNVNCNNVTNSHNNIINLNKFIADENPEIMRWLSPLDPRRRHQDLGNERFDGVGNDSDTLMAARSQPNDNWGSVGNGAKHGEKHVGGGSGM